MTQKTYTHTSKISDKIPEETREHYRKSREEFRAAVKNLLPEEFIEHRRTARKEILLALRSLLDSALEKMEKKD
jgi:hypothetical protein